MRTVCGCAASIIHQKDKRFRVFRDVAERNVLAIAAEVDKAQGLVIEVIPLHQQYGITKYLNEWSPQGSAARLHAYRLARMRLATSADRCSPLLPNIGHHVAVSQSWATP